MLNIIPNSISPTPCPTQTLTVGRVTVVYYKVWIWTVDINVIIFVINCLLLSSSPGQVPQLGQLRYQDGCQVVVKKLKPSFIQLLDLHQPLQKHNDI